MMNDTTRFTRRRFLLGAGAAGAAVGAGVLLDRLAIPGSAPATSEEGGPLVLVTLYGGNDGLNTVVPYDDPAYHAARPTLGYTAGEVLDLGEGLGLNPKLAGLHSLWQSGRLAIVRGVGYPQPNLSHFASMDIWQTANPPDGSGAGWVGRWLDLGDDDPMRAISVGATLPPLMRGERRSATAVTAARIKLAGTAALQEAYSALQAPAADRQGLAAAVAASGSDLLAAAADLDRLSTSTGDQSAPAGATDLRSQMALVADLINAGSPTRVYEVSLSSFDDHADEKPDHERLLLELDSAVTGFLKSLSGHPTGRQAVVMTYSEFGRRPAENASGGTDHGSAAPLFVAGLGVKGGRFYGEEPSLTSLDDDGNPLHNVDFRSVYATVLDRVLGADPDEVLGGRFPPLDFI
jgi:uncharacterized protein (DUF1501 family)